MTHDHPRRAQAARGFEAVDRRDRVDDGERQFVADVVAVQTGGAQAVVVGGGDDETLVEEPSGLGSVVVVEQVARCAGRAPVGDAGRTMGPCRHWATVGGWRLVRREHHRAHHGRGALGRGRAVQDAPARGSGERSGQLNGLGSQHVTALGAGHGDRVERAHVVEDGVGGRRRAGPVRPGRVGEFRLGRTPVARVHLGHLVGRIDWTRRGQPGGDRIPVISVAAARAADNHRREDGDQPEPARRRTWHTRTLVPGQGTFARWTERRPRRRRPARTHRRSARDRRRTERDQGGGVASAADPRMPRPPSRTRHHHRVESPCGGPVTPLRRTWSITSRVDSRGPNGRQDRWRRDGHGGRSRVVRIRVSRGPPECRKCRRGRHGPLPQRERAGTAGQIQVRGTVAVGSGIVMSGRSKSALRPRRLRPTPVTVNDGLDNVRRPVDRFRVAS